MKKEELDKFMNELLSKANALEFDDYYTAMNIVREFKKFVVKNSKYLHPFNLDSIGNVEAELEIMKKNKKHELKQKHWENALHGLKSEIESLEEDSHDLE